MKLSTKNSRGAFNYWEDFNRSHTMQAECHDLALTMQKDHRIHSQIDLRAIRTQELNKTPRWKGNMDHNDHLFLKLRLNPIRPGGGGGKG